MAALNADAPEFYPNQLHKLQSISYPTFPTTISSHSQLYYYFASSSFPCRRVPLPHPFFYYPTTPLPLKSISFHPNNPTPIFPPEAEQLQTHFLKTADEPSRLEIHEVQPQQQQQQQQQRQHQQEKEVAKASGSKAVVQKHVYNIISCGRPEGPPRSRRLRLQPFVCRRKETKEIAEEDKYCEEQRFMKNRQEEIIRQQHYSRAFPHKKRVFPVIPVRPDGDETTVMIKNIPSKYTREMLVQFLENHCMEENEKDKENGEENILEFDFVYLPIDFKHGMNKGYAFVNFTKPEAAWRFLLTASHRKWELFQSHKIREVVVARIQGKEKLERHFETMNFPCESEDVLPVCFSPPRDGVIKGNQRTLGKILNRTYHQL